MMIMMGGGEDVRKEQGKRRSLVMERLRLVEEVDRREQLQQH
jgi:hypothetical protein